MFRLVRCNSEGVLDNCVVGLPSERQAKLRIGLTSALSMIGEDEMA